MTPVADAKPERPQGIPFIERFVAHALNRRHPLTNPPESTVRPVRIQQRDLTNLESSLAMLESAPADPAAIRSPTRTLEHPRFGPLAAATRARSPSLHEAIHPEQARPIAQGIR